MRMNVLKPIVVVVFCLLTLTITAQRKKVSRVDEDKEVNLSGRWNDTDSKLVADEMVADGLARPWIDEFSGKKSKRPAVIVGIIKNMSAEHINAGTFINDIERGFINSGKVRVVQAGEAREQLRKERGEQQQYASLETAKKWGLELGADFILQGTINSIDDSNKKLRLIYYQIDLELVDIENNEKVWIGSKRIKKEVKR